ncbi:hypothetical protein K6L44_03810 [Gluconacetobacter entanii]|uniref:hypothetical protein n=1 Tax=Gluconacetobacter entanii TaxID=108528 RepID=UPI001C9360E3|nr:hypothetical protein [Gluconacetobacter entanii]MBY4639142.1 hypothetical protein [Gluconacetobacter entanii]MCW4579821.1 hypothetical protein [Gluconacetobacter entanii]MCW4583239.1 hypothetical protein [Gluconacetobacter entanii]MCW4586588.1 hypothetical protein [Gluconacetobacter entanii]
MPIDLSGIAFSTYQEQEISLTIWNKKRNSRSLKVLNTITILYLYTALGRARESSTIIKTGDSGSTFSDSSAQCRMAAGRHGGMEQGVSP